MYVSMTAMRSRDDRPRSTRFAEAIVVGDAVIVFKKVHDLRDFAFGSTHFGYRLLDNINAPLEVIAAVLIGGTAITGGKGSVLGSLLGILAMFLLLNGFNLLGLNPFWNSIILGIILIYVVVRIVFQLFTRKSFKAEELKNHLS